MASPATAAGREERHVRHRRVCARARPTPQRPPSDRALRLGEVRAPRAGTVVEGDPSMTPPIGIAHLTLLRLTPPELVAVAAEAGYDFVGIRVKAVTAGERRYAMEPGSPLSRETVARLPGTGLEVGEI